MGQANSDNAPAVGAGPTCDRQSVWRILDASMNRASEGLRVVEDYARFALADRHLTEQFKVLRHDLAATGGQLSSTHRYAARNVREDVGAEISTPAEWDRADAYGVCVASLQRAKQSVRSLEEFGKVVSATAARRFEQLRYRLYTLEVALARTGEAIDRLAATRLYVLLDGRQSNEAFATIARQLVAAGVDAIQLREKRLSDAEMVRRARALREVVRGDEGCGAPNDAPRTDLTAAPRVGSQVEARCLAIINDRPDIAAAVDADGVHLGQDDLGVQEARSIVGPQRLIGVSTHSIDQARTAVLDGADYLGVGPTFASRTKNFANFPGLELTRQVSAEIGLPAFAIGGISSTNLSTVLRAGASRAAVGAAITQASDPYQAAADLRRMLAENFEAD